MLCKHQPRKNLCTYKPYLLLYKQVLCDLHAKHFHQLAHGQAYPACVLKQGIRIKLTYINTDNYQHLIIFGVFKLQYTTNPMYTCKRVNETLQKHGINVQNLQFLSTCNVWSSLLDVFFSLFHGQGLNVFDKLATIKLALGTLTTL